jgi:hypothetical protein
VSLVHPDYVGLIPDLTSVTSTTSHSALYDDRVPGSRISAPIIAAGLAKEGIEMAYDRTQTREMSAADQTQNVEKIQAYPLEISTVPQLDAPARESSTDSKLSKRAKALEVLRWFVQDRYASNVTNTIIELC